MVLGYQRGDFGDQRVWTLVTKGKPLVNKEKDLGDKRERHWEYLDMKCSFVHSFVSGKAP